MWQHRGSLSRGRFSRLFAVQFGQRRPHVTTLLIRVQESVRPRTRSGNLSCAAPVRQPKNGHHAHLLESHASISSTTFFPRWGLPQTPDQGAWRPSRAGTTGGSYLPWRFARRRTCSGQSASGCRTSCTGERTANTAACCGRAYERRECWLGIGADAECGVRKRVGADEFVFTAHHGRQRFLCC